MASLELGSVVADPSLIDAPYEADAPLNKRRFKFRWGRGTILILAAAYFILPFYAGMEYSLQQPTGGFSLTPLSQIASAPGFVSALWLSTQLAVITMAVVMLLMVPTVIYVHLRLPRFRRVMEVITILPIIIPPIAYSVGVLESAPQWLRNSQYLLAVVYVILAMPYVYRSLDSGLGRSGREDFGRGIEVPGLELGDDDLARARAQLARSTHVGLGLNARVGLWRVHHCER